MKGFNLVLAILIFLLAVTSAVFSFFLFEKRDQLVNDHGRMGERFGEVAAMFDKNSGTKLAAEVNKTSLNHGNSQALEGLLKKFFDTTGAVVAERDALAKALAGVSTTLGKNDLGEDKFMRLDSYQSAVNALNAYVAKYKARNDKFVSSLVNWGKKMNVSLNSSALNGDSYAAQLGNFDRAFNNLVTRESAFVAGIKKIASELNNGVNSNQRVTVKLESSYSGDVSKVVALATAVVNAKKDAEVKLANALNKIKALESKVSNLNGEIAQLKAELERRQQEIVRLNRILGNEVPRTPIADGSAEALHMIKTQSKGNVISVSEKFGFIVVSLGTATRVQDQFGNKVDNIDPQIPEGAILTVVRNMPSGEAQYINTVKIVRLDENCSIAEPVDKDNGLEIRPGDVVFFSDAEVKKIVESRK